ncbi:MAG: hypothetical protein AAGU19_13670 [Prolixibacteraceae bacterium]
MTRKISHIAISLLLVILTAGFSVSKHYCGGMLVEVSVFAGSAAGCQESGNACTMNGGCCHNEQLVVQIENTYTTPVVLDSILFFPVLLAVFDLSFLRTAGLSVLNRELLSIAESPPSPDVLTRLSGLQVFRL